MRFPFLNKKTEASVDPAVVEARQAVLLAQKKLVEVSTAVKPVQAPKPKSVNLGPLERVIIFDRGNGGTIWLAALPHRILMEHVDIIARRMKKENKGTNAFLWGFLGLLFGLPIGGFGGLIVLIGGWLPIGPLMVLFGLTIIGILAGVIPGAIIGYRRKGFPIWFIRRDGEVIEPIRHQTFEQERFKGHVTTRKEADGSIRVVIPPGVKAQSASFMYHACRSSDWKGLWKGGQTKWAKMNTVALMVIAVGVVIALFLAGTISSGGAAGGVSSTPSPTSLQRER